MCVCTHVLAYKCMVACLHIYVCVCLWVWKCSPYHHQVQKHTWHVDSHRYEIYIFKVIKFCFDFCFKKYSFFVFQLPTNLFHSAKLWASYIKVQKMKGSCPYGGATLPPWHALCPTLPSSMLLMSSLKLCLILVRPRSKQYNFTAISLFPVFVWVF